MADVIPHFCTGTGCEALHGGGGDNPEVKIARINADRDIKVAQLGRSEARQEIEAQVEQTEIIAEATVEEAVVEAAVLGEIMTPEPEPAPEPVVVEIPDSEPEPEPDVVPAPTEIAPAAEESKSAGWWSGYR